MCDLFASEFCKCVLFADHHNVLTFLSDNNLCEKRQAKHDSHWSRFVIDDLQIFALKSISFNDLPFLYGRMGGSLNISLSSG